jgi:hypothetical protein
MALWVWSVIASSDLLFGQLQNFGTDPEEKKRGEKMISQSEKGIALNENMVKQQRISSRQLDCAFSATLSGLTVAER